MITEAKGRDVPHRPKRLTLDYPCSLVVVGWVEQIAVVNLAGEKLGYTIDIDIVPPLAHFVVLCDICELIRVYRRNQVSLEHLDNGYLASLSRRGDRNLGHPVPVAIVSGEFVAVVAAPIPGAGCGQFSPSIRREKGATR